MIYVLGSGTGGELTVNAPAGVTVIAVNNSNSKTYSKVADASGMAVFKSLPEATYSVHITDGQQSTDPIQVSVQYKTSASITWFSATINVTYPAGSTCTCSNGSTVYTAGNTSGSWTFTVPRAGTWTVSCANGIQSRSQNVSITYTGQAASVLLTYIVYLYNQGDQCSALTGGWNASTWKGVKQTEVYDTYLQGWGASGYYDGVIAHNNPITMQGNTLCLDLNISQRGNLSYLGLTRATYQTGTVDPSYYIASVTVQEVTPRQIYRIHVPHGTQGYVCCGCKGPIVMQLYRAWME